MIGSPAGKRAGWATSTTNEMTKKEVLLHYEAATKSEKDAITAAAREYLNGRKIKVDRRSLDYWRKNEMPRSPLARRYLDAYRIAITRRTMKPAAE